MFQSSISDASPLTLDQAAHEIRQASIIPFNVDDLLAQHAIQLSGSLHDKWPGKPQAYTVNEAMENLKKSNNNDKPMQEQTRVCVRAYLQTTKKLPEWITHASEEIRHVAQARDTLEQVIIDIEKSTPLQ